MRIFNANRQLYWHLPETPVDSVYRNLYRGYKTSATVTAARSTLGANIGTALAKYSKGCYFRNKVYFPPANNEDFLVINTISNTATTTTFSLNIPSSSTTLLRFIGAQVGADGRIYCFPRVLDYFIIIDPLTDTAIETTFGLSAADRTSFSHPVRYKRYLVAANAPESKLVFIDTVNQTAEVVSLSTSLQGSSFGINIVGDDLYILPGSNDKFIIINLRTMNIVETDFDLGLTTTSAIKYTDGVVSYNGKIYCTPLTANEFIVVNSNNNTATTITSSSLVSTNNIYGAVVGIDGLIYCIPSNVNTIIMIDPEDDSITTNDFSTSWTGSLKYRGACLAPNGKIYMAPRNSNDIGIIDFNVAIPERFCIG